MHDLENEISETLKKLEEKINNNEGDKDEKELSKIERLRKKLDNLLEKYLKQLK